MFPLRLVQPRGEFADRHPRGLDDGFPLDRHRPAFRFQARSAAFRAGLPDQELFDLFPVGFILDVRGMPAQQIGGDSLELPLGVGLCGFDIREVAPEPWILRAEKEQIAGGGLPLADRIVQIEREPVVLGGRAQLLGIMRDVPILPARDRAFGDGFLFVDQFGKIRRGDHAQPGARRAGAFGFVEREIRHADVRDRLAAVRAIRRVLAARLLVPLHGSRGGRRVRAFSRNAGTAGGRAGRRARRR